MSISTIAYEWPLRLATSSTPSTLTGPVSGSGRRRTSRIKVNQDTAVPRAAASREPARSASASATFSSRPRSPAVRRWYRAVSPGTCPANVAYTVDRVWNSAVLVDNPRFMQAYVVDGQGLVHVRAHATLADPSGVQWATANVDGWMNFEPETFTSRPSVG